MLSSIRAFRAPAARSLGSSRAAFSVLSRPIGAAAVGRSALRASLRARISALETLRSRGSRCLSTESTEKKEEVVDVNPFGPGGVAEDGKTPPFDMDAFLKSDEGKAFADAQSEIKDAEKQREAEKIPKSTEHRAGDTQKMTFQTETRQILDIVAKSLYHDKEVFLRELISNASDALEKLRYFRSTNAAVAEGDQPLEIHVVGDEEKKTLTVQDFGVGMTKDELVSNLGTIARSGSKAFIKEMKEKGAALDPTSIIGQFGVGFYSSFMVSNKVEVFSRSAVDPEQQHYWSSDGSGEYEIAKAEGTPVGTKIVMHLRDDCLEFTKKRVIEKIIQKYSNFVGSPIFLNGKRLNTVTAIWTRNKNEVTDEQHEEFYRFISNAYDTPTFRMHFTTDSPISIKALFYFPERHTEKYGMGRLEPGVSLYSRKILIQPKSKQILPDWLRFVKGVVDSEDIPLNISRENMQDNALITRMNHALVRRIIKFLDDQAKQDKKKFNAFVEEFGMFLKEGVVTDPKHKGEIARLLRYDSSAGPDVTSLDEYVSRMPPDQKGIYYFVTTNRVMAENSPYLEQFKKKNIEVIFMYQHIDDFVMRNLEEYGKRKLISIESTEANLDDKPASEADKEMHESLCKFFQEALPDRVASVRVSERLTSSPCMILDHESAAMRKMIKYVDMKMSSYMPKQKLEINPNHEIIRRIYSIKDKQPAVARLVVEQLFDNALIAADILDNPQQMLPRLNKLMLEVLDTSGHGAAPVAAPESSVSSTEKPADEAPKQ